MERSAWDQIRRTYGQRVTLCRGEDRVEVRAFFQPVNEKKAGWRPTALGVAPVGKWLYLGPAEEELDGVRELVWEGRSFALVRCREVPVGEETLFRWAVAEEMDGERVG